MSATALRISTQQWSSTTTSIAQTATETLGRRAASSSQGFLARSSPSTFSAMALPGVRRCFSTPATTAFHRRFPTNTPTTTVAARTTREEIWKRNFSRLYARRMLEVAAVAAASQRFVTELEEAIERPSNWKDWEYRDWTDDLLKSLGTTKFERFCTSAQRIVSLGLLATPMVLLYPLAQISETAHRWSWDYALWGIEQAGPTLIKLTQWATTRQDLFSPEFCLHFGKLRDETIGHSFDETQKILVEEFGADHASWLDMETTPIGSGCIAQVYRGTLREATSTYPKGTEIALKIQHPGIWHKVCADFYLLAKMADWLESLPKLNLKYLSLADTVRQFRDIMLPQLDLTIEAKNLKRFNVDFAGDDDVTFPRPLDELTTPRVLTETFIHGTPIMEYTKAPVEARRQVALIGLTTTLNMIFLKDFNHGTSSLLYCTMGILIVCATILFFHLCSNLTRSNIISYGTASFFVCHSYCAHRGSSSVSKKEVVFAIIALMKLS